MPYRFGRFVFDPDRGLFSAGAPVPLEPRAADLLRYFLENPRRIVTRDELSERLWGASFVSDAAISTQIRAVRKALGDDRTRQTFIRTHPRRGFSFVCPVEQIATDLGEEEAARISNGLARRPNDDAVPADREMPAPGTGRPLARLMALTAILLAIAFGVGFWTRIDGTAPTVARPLSIAVLPFDNLSGDASKDYLSDAFTEDLITDLSRINDAFVISRSTSFTYRRMGVDAATVAAELGVRYVLEGSLRIDGARVRINAQLIDGATNGHLWSDRYERNLSELFDLQDNLTGQIAAALRAELRMADNRRQDPEITEDAWDYALRGNVILYNHQSVADYQQAHALLSEAVSLDPSISSAWGGLAFVHFVASLAEIPGVSRPDSAVLSLEAAQMATQADPMNAEPYWLVGAGYVRTGQPELGMAACETAMALNPNMDCGHVCAGLVHLARDEPDMAVPFFEHALELNPRFRPFVKERYLGLAHIQAGQYELAMAALNRALAEAPTDGFANLALISTLALDGQTAAARDLLLRHLERSEGEYPNLSSMREHFGWLGPGVERMLSGLRTVGIADG